MYFFFNSTIRIAKTPVSPSQTRKSQTPQREEFMLNKMGNIDKKLKALEDKYNK